MDKQRFEVKIEAGGIEGNTDFVWTTAFDGRRVRWCEAHLHDLLGTADPGTYTVTVQKKRATAAAKIMRCPGKRYATCAACGNTAIDLDDCSCTACGVRLTRLVPLANLRDKDGKPLVEE